MAQLTDFIVSKTRIKLLEIFYGNPKQIHHVRDLVRLVEEEINAVRRELLRMEEVGMVRREQRGNRVYYEVRSDYPFYPELLELVGKTAGLGAAIRKNREKLGKLSYVMFSGRFVRWMARKNEDEVDILIVGDVVLPELATLIHDEQKNREDEINYTPMTKEEFEFRKRRRDPFLLGILAGSKVMIIGDEESFVG
ncbi:winged helix-turn-helix transcriptional regulator [Candidatus Microgenomates bacterium]|nr:winged helix-turn-helix transcriptional regulator [Candidatus Microgenomates bacterium]